MVYLLRRSIYIELKICLWDVARLVQFSRNISSMPRELFDPIKYILKKSSNWFLINKGICWWIWRTVKRPSFWPYITDSEQWTNSSSFDWLALRLWKSKLVPCTYATMFAPVNGSSNADYNKAHRLPIIVKHLCFLLTYSSNAVSIIITSCPVSSLVTHSGQELKLAIKFDGSGRCR